MITLLFILLLVYLNHVIRYRSKVVKSTHKQIKNSYIIRIIFGIIITIAAIVLIIYGCKYEKTSFFDVKGILYFLLGFFTTLLSIIGCIISFFRWKKFSNMTEAEYIEYQEESAYELEEAEEDKEILKTAHKITKFLGGL